MTGRRLLAWRLSRGGLADRLFKFHASVLRARWTAGEPRRWREPPARGASRLADRADARKGWRYEGPGVWSAPVGLLRALWWRLRARRRGP